MKSSGTGRVLATLFLGVILGIFRHYQQMRQLARGRELFVAQQNLYFDRITQTHSLGFTIVAAVILAAIAVGLYELISAGFTKMAGPSTAEE
jgi:hypothetical protein